MSRNIGRLPLLRWQLIPFFALVLFAVSVWQANRNVCPGCAVSDVWLTLPDGIPIHSRLYLPPEVAPVHGQPSGRPAKMGQGEGIAHRKSTRTNLAAIIVCPGYLANLAFMEFPWANDTIDSAARDTDGEHTLWLTTWRAPLCRRRARERHTPPARRRRSAALHSGQVALRRSLGAAGLLLALAAATTLLSGALFQRMSRAPGYLLAAVLVLSAAYRLGGRARSGATAVVATALTISWLGAVVCALY